MTGLDERISILGQGGFTQPARVARIIRDTIDFLELDLSGWTVLTEAASGPYVVTPVIAALAGAKRVLALTRDSHHGSVETVMRQIRAFESLCGLEGFIEICSQLDFRQNGIGSF
jgi:hypothetical protein